MKTIFGWMLMFFSMSFVVGAINSASFVMLSIAVGLFGTSIYLIVEDSKRGN